jgi:hypothetical protein
MWACIHIAADPNGGAGNFLRIWNAARDSRAKSRVQPVKKLDERKLLSSRWTHHHTPPHDTSVAAEAINRRRAKNLIEPPLQAD